MESIIYKKWNINHVYDCSRGYKLLNYWKIWTPNMLDVVGEDFKSLKSAKKWIDENQSTH